MELFKKLSAEFLGTFFLVLVGAGSMVLDLETGGAVTGLGVSLSFGLIVFLMILLFGSVSGAHINPAVTIGFWLSGNFSRAMVLPFLMVQLLGAAVASWVTQLIFPHAHLLGNTLPQAGYIPAFVLEVIITAILMYTILLVSIQKKKTVPVVALIVGLVVGLAAYFIGPFTGASMNPARSFGPALISGNWEGWIIYCVAPVFGSAVAVFQCRLLYRENCCEVKSIG